MMWPFKHRHKWETTHTNRYQLPTRQVCKCGLVREVSTKLAKQPLSYVWVYSDGNQSEEYPLGDYEG